MYPEMATNSTGTYGPDTMFNTEWFGMDLSRNSFDTSTIPDLDTEEGRDYRRGRLAADVGYSREFMSSEEVEF